MITSRTPSTPEVRQAIATKVIELVDMKESQALLGVDIDPATVIHGTFSVLMDGEENTRELRDRELMRVVQQVTIRFAWRLRPSRHGVQLDDYDDALSKADLISGLLPSITDWQEGLDIVYLGTPARDDIGAGTFLVQDLRFAVTHNRTVYTS